MFDMQSVTVSFFVPTFRMIVIILAFRNVYYKITLTIKTYIDIIIFVKMREKVTIDMKGGGKV